MIKEILRSRKREIISYELQILPIIERKIDIVLGIKKISQLRIQITHRTRRKYRRQSNSQSRSHSPLNHNIQSGFQIIDKRETKRIHFHITQEIEGE